MNIKQFAVRVVRNPKTTLLTVRQLALLAVLEEATQMATIRGLASELGMWKGVTTRNVSALYCAGLVSKTTPAHDKRDCLIAITAKGVALLDEMRGAPGVRTRAA